MGLVAASRVKPLQGKPDQLAGDGNHGVRETIARPCALLPRNHQPVRLEDPHVLGEQRAGESEVLAELARRALPRV